MPDIVTLDDMPSDLDVDDRIRWLNANVEGMIEARLPWRDQIIQSFPIYLKNPMGLGYYLHDAYLNGSVEDYDRHVDMRRDIIPFQLPDKIELTSSTGDTTIAPEIFLDLVAEAIRHDPTYKSQDSFIPQSISWRTGMGKRGLLISTAPVIQALRDWLTQCISEYLGKIRNVRFHLLSPLIKGSASLQSVWGVTYRHGGTEMPHIHRDGFVSGVFYVKLSPEISHASGDAQPGWLRFGEGLIDREPSHPRKLTLKPKEGCLFVFPGYIPHRMLEFGPSDQERICISFDAR
jgi:hypothetical protein